MKQFVNSTSVPCGRSMRTALCGYSTTGFMCHVKSVRNSMSELLVISTTHFLALIIRTYNDARTKLDDLQKQNDSNEASIEEIEAKLP